MATRGKYPEQCRYCLHSCNPCLFEENKRIRYKIIEIRPLKRLPEGSTLPPKTKRISGRRYSFLDRYKTQDAASDRARYLRQLHTHRIGYSLRVVVLPKSQWGAVDWDIKPVALYVLYGREKTKSNKGLSQLFGWVNMPYQNPKYQHIRRRPPKTIDPNSYSTVPVTHTKATGTYPRGTLARIGRSRKTGNMVIQAILIPLKKR